MMHDPDALSIRGEVEQRDGNTISRRPYTAPEVIEMDVPQNTMFDPSACSVSDSP